MRYSGLLVLPLSYLDSGSQVRYLYAVSWHPLALNILVIGSMRHNWVNPQPRV